MPEFASPLRYPGGKAGLSPLLARIIQLNDQQDGIYAEPYGGGAGAALRLLFGEYVSRILINDLDSCVVAFWRAILNQTKKFLEMLDGVPVTLDEWHRQRAIYLQSNRHSQLSVGFATFFLNRCNRSGIIVDGGPIGGTSQKGTWKIDARYYRETIRQRIEKIASYKDPISVSNLDAIDFLKTVVSPLSEHAKVFVYLDPPYYRKGDFLYLNSYSEADHAELSTYVVCAHKYRWLISYDNVAPIRRLYRGLRQVSFRLRYTAYERRTGKELLICRPELMIPSRLKPWISPRNSA
jgi:DNA adenine methylase